MTTPTRRIRICPKGFSDHTFEVDHGVSIPLRIWPASSTAKKPAPWLFWIHGGGWQGGQHYIPNAWVHPAFSERGYHIVSTAYRFMPECSLEDQIDDLKDSFKWCREHLPSIVGAGTIDIETYVVAGDSAGGTHSTLMGHFLQPRPKVVIDVFGVVDMTDPVYWNVRPDFVPLPYIHPRNEQELDQHLKSRDKSQAVVTSAWRWELEPNLSVDRLRLFWGAPDYTPTDEKDFFRQDAYNYCNRIKHRMRILFRHEECANDEQVKERAKARSSLYLLDEATSYPPTFILHGTGDTAVPVEQSYRFVEKLKEKGIPCGAAYCPGGEHSFENAIEGPEDEGWAEYIVPCMEFVDKHVKGYAHPIIHDIGFHDQSQVLI